MIKLIAHRILHFESGDLVMVKFPFAQVGKPPKLAPSYRGPFEIIEKISNLNYNVLFTLK